MDIQTLTKFFMWCTILNGALMVIWSVFCIFAADFVYRVHSKWFAMPRETFNVVIYAFLGFFKVIFMVFSVIPYVALLIIG